MVAMEEPAALPAVEQWPAETPGTKRPLPSTGAEAEAGGQRKRRARVITIHLIQNIFSAIVVIVRAAMWRLNGGGVRRCSGSVAAIAAERWSGFWSGKDDGRRVGRQNGATLEWTAVLAGSVGHCGYERDGERLDILPGLKMQLRFDVPAKEEGRPGIEPVGLFLVSLLPNGRKRGRRAALVGRRAAGTGIGSDWRVLLALPSACSGRRARHDAVAG